MLNRSSYFFTIALALIVTHLHAQEIRTSGTSIKAFIPAGWKAFMQIEGDLNKDSIPDAAIIIQQTDKENMIKNTGGLGPATLDLNPRMLLVLLKDNAGTYHLAGENSAIIPSPNTEDNPCEVDPLEQTGALSIKKGVLALHLQHFYSCGSYGVTNEDYVFRYQKNKFELIGYAKEESSRSTGETNKYSINFSTRKTTSTSGDNMFETPKVKPQTVTKQFTVTELLNLDNLNEASFAKIQQQIGD